MLLLYTSDILNVLWDDLFGVTYFMHIHGGGGASKAKRALQFMVIKFFKKIVRPCNFFVVFTQGFFSRIKFV